MTELLLRVEKPARYVGGEFGQIKKEKGLLDTAIAFPDLYEIGMSNQALKILYKNLNSIEGVRCERVFAPAPDFEAELKKADLPLCTLESRIPLRNLDIVGVTLGYELGATGMLSILHSGGIPIRANERTSADPLVILGGPAASNPVPFSLFADGVWIGEAEAGFFSLIRELARIKGEGGSRADLLERMRRESAMWMPGKKAERAVDASFADRPADPAIFPVPNMKIVQDHGSVEIMRGCPNGCRFCHAGVWYRPMRQKPIETIEREVELFVDRGGYREVSLSSLSSGDYSGIGTLVHRLNAQYKAKNISFQLPSLKVSTFSLPLLETISEVRKSGLTFAIETPTDAWQLSINKEVSIENVVSILREAKVRGWKQAKFYFMIGLPVHPEGSSTEEDSIVDFLLRVKKETTLSLNVNIGTFVPKPHTPYQWCAQISESESHDKLKYIRDALRKQGFKVSTHDPFVSSLEGLISRGDRRIGELILKAFNLGCRLDAWEDYIRKDIWRSLLEAEGQSLIEENRAERPLESELPWEDVSSGVGKNYLKKEYKRSIERKLSAPCDEDCPGPCGVCCDDLSVAAQKGQASFAPAQAEPAPAGVSAMAPERTARPTRRLVFSFSKTGNAIFWPHLSIVEIFSKAFVRSAIDVQYTEGFNPLPKLDFASPLSLGLYAENEIATVDVLSDIGAEDFVRVMNACLPDDMRVKAALAVSIPEGTKKVSAASILWGFSYRFDSTEYTHAAAEDKAFRESLRRSDERIPAGLVRTSILAKDESGEPIDYFTMYGKLYNASR
jgi:radical SAM superfamily enzyme YgiQ (UPF0313 family)